MKNTAVTTTTHDSTLVIAGAADFTSEELATIKGTLSGPIEKQLHVMNREYLQLDSALVDAQIAIRRAQQRLRDTKEFQLLQNLKRDEKMLRARRDEIRLKAHGLFETALSGVQRGRAMYKKMVSLLAVEEEV